MLPAPYLIHLNTPQLNHSIQSFSLQHHRYPPSLVNLQNVRGISYFVSKSTLAPLITGLEIRFFVAFRNSLRTMLSNGIVNSAIPTISQAIGRNLLLVFSHNSTLLSVLLNRNRHESTVNNRTVKLSINLSYIFALSGSNNDPKKRNLS